MKKIFVILCSLSMALSVQAKSKEDSVTIDQVKYRITYTLKYVMHPSVQPYIYLTDDNSRLDIGEKGIAHYYSRTNEIVKTALAEMLEKSANIDYSALPKGHGFTWEYVKGYPSADKSSFFDNIISANYQCVEDVETPEWSLVSDSTATIMGYPCQMATATFKGRVWSAWYTEDIPLDNGPWKLGGLPGLILRAYDSEKQYIFDAVGMETCKDTPLQIVKKQRETVSQKDLRELRAKDDINELIRSGAKVKIYDSKGNPIDAKKFVINQANKPKENTLER